MSLYLSLLPRYRFIVEPPFLPAYLQRANLFITQRHHHQSMNHDTPSSYDMYVLRRVCINWPAWDWDAPRSHADGGRRSGGATRWGRRATPPPPPPPSQSSPPSSRSPRPSTPSPRPRSPPAAATECLQPQFGRNISNNTAMPYQWRARRLHKWLFARFNPK